MRLTSNVDVEALLAFASSFAPVAEAVEWPTIGDVLELLHVRRRALQSLTIVYGYEFKAPASGRDAAVDVAGDLRVAVASNGSASVQEPLDNDLRPVLGNVELLVDPAILMATSSVRPGPPRTVEDRVGWAMKITPQAPVAFPQQPVQLRLFPVPVEPAEWEVVIDTKSGVVLELTCRVAGEVIGSLRMNAMSGGGERAASVAVPVPGYEDKGITVDSRVIEAMKEDSGWCVIVIECDDPERAHEAVVAAREAVCRVRHPEEPDDPLVSFVSDATDGPGRSSFWFDMADAEAYDGLVEEVLEAIVSVAAASGLTHGHIKSETAPDGDHLR